MGILNPWSGGISFNPPTDIPTDSLTGKVALVTGGNSGLGAETVHHLARAGCTVYLAARTLSTANATLKIITHSIPTARIKLLELDLSSFDSISTAAARIQSETHRLDLLILNAGVAGTSAFLTASGYENQWGVNHMGHVLLTKLLWPVMLATAAQQAADVRCIILSSDAHDKFVPAQGIDFDVLKTDAARYMSLKRYGMSKLGNVCFGKELSRRYPQIKTVIVHPGGVFTGITRGAQVEHPWLVAVLTPLLRLVLQSVEEGARNQLWAATAGSGDVRSGEYYVPVGRAQGGSNLANDESFQAQVWAWTEKELKAKGFDRWPTEGEANT